MLVKVLIAAAALVVLLTWSMAGRNAFMAKAIHLVVNMDRMIGGMFEKGLAEMKSVAETAGRG
jgi:hypothetical protein